MLDGRAARCRSVADTLDVRRAVVVERHRPVAALHLEEVWRGRAATASRATLQRVIGAALYSLGADLASASGALRSEATSLEHEAAALRTRARIAAEAEARAAAEAEARAQAQAQARARARNEADNTAEPGPTPPGRPRRLRLA